MQNIFIYLILLIIILTLVVLYISYFGTKAFNKIKIYIIVIFFMFFLYFVLNSTLNHSPKGYFYHLHDIDFSNYLIFFISIINALLLFRTLKAQRKAIDEQKTANQIAAFENRFFKFIDFHRENVAIIKYRKPNYQDNDSDEKKYSNGKEFFIILSNELNRMFDEYSIQNSTKELLNRESKIKKINFIYSCLFFGAWEDKRNLIIAKRSSSKLVLGV